MGWKLYGFETKMDAKSYNASHGQTSCDLQTLLHTFFGLSGACCKVTFLIFWKGGLLQNYKNPKSLIWNKMKFIIYFQISFAWLTDILSTAWSEGNRKLKIPAKKTYYAIFFCPNDPIIRLSVQTDFLEIRVLELKFSSVCKSRKKCL